MPEGYSSSDRSMGQIQTRFLVQQRERIISMNANFIKYIIKICKEDKGTRAELRRADKGANSWRGLSIVVSFGENIINKDKRMIYSLIISSIARSGIDSDGGSTLGGAFKKLKANGNISNNSAELRLRRLLSCRSTSEVLRVLQKSMSILESNSDIKYSVLLHDLLNFDTDRQEQIKTVWAQDFYK